MINGLYLVCVFVEACTMSMTINIPCKHRQAGGIVFSMVLFRARLVLLVSAEDHASFYFIDMENISVSVEILLDSGKIIYNYIQRIFVFVCQKTCSAR